MFGAVCYAVYVVLLRRIAGENLNIVMFLGESFHANVTIAAAVFHMFSCLIH